MKKQNWCIKIKTYLGETFNVPQPNTQEALKDVEIATKHSNFKEITLKRGKKC